MMWSAGPLTFCPLAVDWGSVADWFTAIGTVSAVVAALYIAGNERRSAKRERKLALDDEQTKRQQVLEEAIRLAEQAGQLAGSYAQLVTLGGGSTPARRLELIHDLNGIQSQLEALQRFPINDPRVFAEIGRTAFECRVEPGIENTSTSYAGIVMTDLAERMRRRRDTLEQLRADQNQPPS